MRVACAGLAAVLAASVLAGAAHAELFRCTGPDGKTIFTDKKQTCPGAEPSEPAGVVHRAETPEAAQHDAVDGPRLAHTIRRQPTRQPRRRSGSSGSSTPSTRSSRSARGATGSRST